VIRTVEEARQAARDEPKRWRMALCEAHTLPILEDRECKVTLYATKKGAHEALRARSSALLASGWKRSYGTLARGVLVYTRDDETVGIGLDYAGRLT
jgi:hypothetical protein